MKSGHYRFSYRKMADLTPEQIAATMPRRWTRKETRRVLAITILSLFVLGLFLAPGLAAYYVDGCALTKVGRAYGIIAGSTGVCCGVIWALTELNRK